MKIGVLGGIGIEASAYFYYELVKKLQNSGVIQSNTNYPHIVINSIPAPELHLEEHNTPEILEPYLEGVRELVSTKPDLIVMVCNTIHIYLEDIKALTQGIPILSMPSLVYEKLKVESLNKVCVLGTGLTVTRGLYEFDDFSYIDLSPPEQKVLCDVVVNFNNGGELNKNKEKLMNLVNRKRKEGADFFILACTEVSEILGKEDINMLDTLELLIDETFKKSLIS